MRAQVLESLRSCEPREGGVRARFAFARDLSVFEGHFPGRPLVPGVFLIEAARLSAERALGAPQQVARVVKAKFSGEVGPDAEVALDAELRDGTLKARLSTDAGLAASLTLELSGAPA